MDSTARFLLGGALGAALGFLISQKNLEKALKGVQPSAAPAGPEGAGVEALAAAQLVEAPARPKTAPEARPERPSRPVTEIPPPMTPPATPAGEGRLEAELLPSVAPTAAVSEAPSAAAPDAPPVETPPVEAPPWRPIPRQAPQRDAEPPSAPPAPTTSETSEAPEAAAPPTTPVTPRFRPPDPEIIVTRRFLEEPLPGSGWASRDSAETSEQAIEDMIPLDSDVILPYAGPEIESAFAKTRPSGPDTEASETVVDEPTAEMPVVEEPVEEAVADLPVVEDVLVDELVEEAIPEAPVVEEPVEEPVAQAPEAVEYPPVVEYPPAIDLPPAVEPPAYVEPAPEAQMGEPPAESVVEVAPQAAVTAEEPEAQPVELVSVEEPTPEPGGTEELLAEISGPGTAEIEVLVETAQIGRPLAPVEAGEEVTIVAEQPPNEPLVFEGADEETGAGGRSDFEALVETASVEPGGGAGLVAELPAAQAIPAGEDVIVELPVAEETEVELPVEDDMVEMPVVAEAESEVEPETEPEVEPEVEPEAVATETAAPVEEAVEVEEVAVESPAIETPIVEVPVVEAPAQEAAVQAAGTRVDDLKARIEETRRRIRQELEQPFVSSEQPAAVEDDWTISSAVPELAPPSEAAAAAESGMLVLEDAAGAATESDTELEEPIDYESMKSRIEMTRSRLKAKAFDAMMTGESALLGRDVGGFESKGQDLSDIDSEVEESIESSLREEED